MPEPPSIIGYEFIWVVFSELQSCRQMGTEQLGPIPWTAINDYAKRHEIYGNEFDELVYFISMLDSYYLSGLQEK